MVHHVLPRLTIIMASVPWLQTIGSGASYLLNSCAEKTVLKQKIIILKKSHSAKNCKRGTLWAF